MYKFDANEGLYMELFYSIYLKTTLLRLEKVLFKLSITLDKINFRPLNPFYDCGKSNFG